MQMYSGLLQALNYTLILPVTDTSLKVNYNESALLALIVPNLPILKNAFFCFSIYKNS